MTHKDARRLSKCQPGANRVPGFWIFRAVINNPSTGTNSTLRSGKFRSAECLDGPRPLQIDGQNRDPVPDEHGTLTGAIPAPIQISMLMTRMADARVRSFTRRPFAPVSADSFGKPILSFRVWKGWPVVEHVTLDFACQQYHQVQSTCPDCQCRRVTITSATLRAMPLQVSKACTPRRMNSTASTSAYCTGAIDPASEGVLQACIRLSV